MLTCTEAANLTARRPELIARWARQGRIAGAVRVGAMWMVPAASLADLRTIPRVNRRPAGT